MIDYYTELRWTHIACALASGLLFAARGALVQSGHSGAANSGYLRYLSYAIDTTLLAAALLLLARLDLSPLRSAWLTTKIVLLLAYIVLGSFALRRAATRAGRRRCLIAALLVYLIILGIARAHDPLGWWLLLRMPA